MPGKIANTLSDSDLTALLGELRSLSGEPTLAQIQSVAKKFGVTVSLMGATTFRDTTFRAHLERLRNGREKSAQILSAVREGGAHPLDAVEEAASADLLDLYTSGEEVDTAAIVKVALQLRASLESRKDRDRLDADLARKIRETDARIEAAEQARLLAEKRVEKMEREKTQWLEQREKVKAAVATAAKKGGLTASSQTAIERAMAEEIAA